VADETSAVAGQPSGAKAVLVYNLLRLALLAACAGLSYLVGLRGLYLVAVAFLASGLISWFALKRQRIRMGAAIERTVERGRGKMAERTAIEDAYADIAHGGAVAEDSVHAPNEADE
jgi:Protein of unknown function (DUF4229)